MIHGMGERQTFKYPREVYLDQFLKENAQLAVEKRKKREDIMREVDKLAERRNDLARFDVCLQF